MRSRRLQPKSKVSLLRLLLRTALIGVLGPAALFAIGQAVND
jgi:hypothetical protein